MSLSASVMGHDRQPARSGVESGSGFRRETVYGTLLLGCAQVTKVASTFLVTAVAFRVLGASAFAIWVLLQSTVNYLALAEFGMGQTLVNGVAVAKATHDRRTVRELMATTLALYGAVSALVLAAMAAVVILPSMSDALRPTAQTSLEPEIVLALGVSVLLRVPLQVWPAALAGLGRTAARQAMDLVLSLLLTAVTCGSLLLARELRGAVFLVSVGTVVTTFLVTAVAALAFRDRLSFSMADFASRRIPALLGSSALFFCISLTIVAQRTIGAFLLAHYAPLDEIGAVLALLSLLGTMGMAVGDLASKVAQPYLTMFAAVGAKTRVLAYARFAVTVTALVAACLVSALTLLGQSGLPALLGKGAAVPHIVLLMLAGGFLVDAVFAAPHNIVVAMNGQRALVGSQFIYVGLILLGGWLGGVLGTSDPVLYVTAGLLAGTVTGRVLGMSLAVCRGLDVGLGTYLGTFVARPWAICVIVLAPLVAALSTTNPLVEASVLAVSLVGGAVAFVRLGLTESDRTLLWNQLSGRFGSALARMQADR